MIEFGKFKGKTIEEVIEIEPSYIVWLHGKNLIEIDDETGKISFKNLKRVAKELGENMTDDEIQEMIEEADRDGDGEIGEEEFMRIMRKTNLF